MLAGVCRYFLFYSALYGWEAGYPDGNYLNFLHFFSQPKILEQYLNIEDSRLLMHLKACAAMSKLPYDLWFKKCFAGCLPESSLQRQDFFFPFLFLIPQ